MTSTARDSRYVKNVAQIFTFGDKSRPLLIKNMDGDTDLFVSQSGVPDSAAGLSDGDTQRVPPGDYFYIPAGGVGPHTLGYITSDQSVRSVRAQAIELGVPTNVDPGAVGGSRDTLEVSPIAEGAVSTVVGTGAVPLLIVNDSDTPVFITVNTGTDPHVSDISTDEKTLELGAQTFLVVDAVGTGYEVRAAVHSRQTSRARLRLSEVL